MRLLVDAFIGYFALFLIFWSLRRGRIFRRLVQLLFRPLAWIGLWHGWSMYAPEVPEGTRLVLAGVRFGDGSFDVVPLPGLDDDRGFGKARDLRFITFQFKLNLKITDYFKPALCDYALGHWRRQMGSPLPSERLPVAVELREYCYPSPDPGASDNQREPSVRTVWVHELSGVDR